MLVMRLWPQTPLARLLHFHLVERPISWAAEIERHQILYFAAVGAMLLVSAEVIAVFGSLELAMVYAFDFSLYLDAALATYMAAVVSQLRTARTWLVRRTRGLAHRVARPADRPRAARHRRSRPQARVASNDDDDGSASRMLAAA